MTKRDQVELVHLLELFYNELGCNCECGKCEYAINFGRVYSCPVLWCKTAVEEEFGLDVKP